MKGVAHALSIEIGHRAEVQANAGALRQKQPDGLGRVRRDAVRDDVNLIASGLPGQDVDTLGRGATGSDPARRSKGTS